MTLQAGSTVAPLSGGDGAQRPCPYCGIWNESDYVFCKKCGQQLPSLAGETPVVPKPLPPPPPAAFIPPPPTATPQGPVSESDDGSVVTRPLTEAEAGLLKRSAKNGAPGMLRFFGAFVGIMPLFMVGMAMMGTPFVPENYIAIVLVTGFLAVVLAGASQGLRAPLLRAAKAGTAYEVSGVPEIRAAPGTRALVGLGGLTFRMKPAQAARLQPDRLNRVTFADGGPVAGARRQLGSSAAVILESNGAVATKAEACYLVGSAEVDGVAAPGAKRAWGR